MRIPNLATDLFTEVTNVTGALRTALHAAVSPGERLSRLRRSSKFGAFLSTNRSPSRAIPRERDQVQDVNVGTTVGTVSTAKAATTAKVGTVTTATQAGTSLRTATKTGTTAKPATTAQNGTKTGTASATKTGSGALASTTTATGGLSSGTRASNSTLTASTPLPSSTVSNLSTTTVTATPSSTPAAKSGGANVGAIVGGVIGGVVCLVLLFFLIAFLSRRHRKQIEERRNKEKTLPSYLDATGMGPHLDKPSSYVPAGEGVGVGGSGHQRSKSTSHDIYFPQQQRGIQMTDSSSNITHSADFSELEGHTSTPPGVRAEGKGGFPSRVLPRAPQMLDGMPVAVKGQKQGQGERVSEGSRPASKSSIFQEHVSEMEDTSGLARNIQKSSPTTVEMESPVLGRSAQNSTISKTSLVEDVRRKQHFMSWNNYDPGQANTDGGDISASMKQPPATRPTLPASAHLSPDFKGEPSDGSFVVSPLKINKAQR